MAAQAQRAPFYPAITESKILVKAGETKIPGDEIGGKESVVQSVGVLFGWVIAESTGSAKAKIRLWDGSTGSSPSTYIATITLVEGESTRDFFPDESLQLKNNAIYIEIVSGSVEGSVLYG